MKYFSDHYENVLAGIAFGSFALISIVAVSSGYIDMLKPNPKTSLWWGDFENWTTIIILLLAIVFFITVVVKGRKLMKEKNIDGK